MPIFSKKFDIKTIPSRVKRTSSQFCPPLQENIDDVNTITLQLGKNEAKFVDGAWIVGSSECSADDLLSMRRKVVKLEEENNLNKVKVDVLLDMLTENISEINVLRRNREMESKSKCK